MGRVGPAGKPLSRLLRSILPDGCRVTPETVLFDLDETLTDRTASLSSAMDLQEGSGAGQRQRYALAWGLLGLAMLALTACLTPPRIPAAAESISSLAREPRIVAV